MSTDVQSYADWLEQAAVPEVSLTPAQQQVLHTAFGFLQEAGSDYYSRRFLSHFLLHCRAGLKTAVIARLCGFSRSSAVDHRGLSTKEVVQAAHHRLAGRAHGKLLPRAMPALSPSSCTNIPTPRRWDPGSDFVQRTWGVSVSRVAPTPLPPRSTAWTRPGVWRLCRCRVRPPRTRNPRRTRRATPAWRAPRSSRRQCPPQRTRALPLPPPEFFLPPPSTPAPSCSCPPPSTGWPPPRTASRMPTARCSAGS